MPHVYHAVMTRSSLSPLSSEVDIPKLLSTDKSIPPPSLPPLSSGVDVPKLVSTESDESNENLMLTQDLDDNLLVDSSYQKRCTFL